jgi:hypothetical protein
MSFIKFLLNLKNIFECRGRFIVERSSGNRNALLLQVSDGHEFGLADGAGIGLHYAGNDSQKCRLTGSVGSNQSDAIVWTDHAGKVTEQNATSVLEDYVLEGKQEVLSMIVGSKNTAHGQYADYSMQTVFRFHVRNLRSSKYESSK